MQVNLPYRVLFENNLLQGEVLAAKVLQKVDGGYIIDLNGLEIFAQSDLSFAPGKLLKLKVIESNPSRLILKVLNTDSVQKGTQEGQPVLSKQLFPAEIRAALKLLSKLNLPATEERVAIVSDLLSGIVNNNEQTGAVRDTSGVLTHLALKALNLIYKESGPYNIYYFALPLQEYKTVYFKLSSHSKTASHKTFLHLSFIVDTQDFGLVLAEIYQNQSSTTASLTFENKDGMEAARKAIARLGDGADSLLKSLKIKMGKISKRDFFLKDLETSGFLPGINLRV
ncbi:MAG: hypothetical protein PWQ97_346 [Tepidanaerobacteraceae bacterium]|nr:hypothetical protein [Tepidanaerobacteraceae bacterium]